MALFISTYTFVIDFVVVTASSLLATGGIFSKFGSVFFILIVVVVPTFFIFGFLSSKLEVLLRRGLRPSSLSSSLKID
jgi:hypothetical protein